MSGSGEEERPDIQKKVFGRWINAKLRRRDIFVTDLYFDLQDGEILLDLISGLTERGLKQEQVRHILNTIKEDFKNYVDNILTFFTIQPT